MLSYTVSEIKYTIDELVENQSKRSETEKILIEGDAKITQLAIEWQEPQSNEPTDPYIPEFNQAENSAPSDNSNNNDNGSDSPTNQPNNKKPTTEKLLLEEQINLAEASIKNKQFNRQVLTKLLTTQQANSSLYQSLNQHGQIDKLIIDLQELEKNQKQSKKENHDNGQKFNIPTPLILFVIVLISILSVGIVVKIRKKQL